MPIGDLLAQIKGEQPKPSSALAAMPSKTPTPAKRKAEVGLNGTAAKTAKMTPMADRSVRLMEKSQAGQPMSPKALPPSSDRRTITDITLSAKPDSVKAGKGHMHSSPVARQPGVTLAKEKGIPGKSSANVATKSVLANDKAPKKRSYAEIMQRATMLQQKMGPIGKIQHKSITETSSNTAGREALRSGSPMSSKRPGGRKVWKSEARDKNGFSASEGRKERAHDQYARESSSDFARSNVKPSSKGDGIKATGTVKSKRGKRQVQEAPKKVKKAALATTGYRGTARPTVSSKGPASSKDKSSLSASKAAVGLRTAGRYGGLLAPRQPRQRDEDEMDDFIEYDDDEDAPGPPISGRGHYDESEEDESDMEAGFSDMESEDHRASAIARREDAEEDAVERKLKQEKEQRKRKLLQGRR